MRRLLLISTALIGFALPGEAAPVGAWVATAVFGFASGTAAFAIVSGVVSLAASAALSAIVGKLTARKPSQEEIRQELSRPTSLPAYRFVYGSTWAPGTPVAWTVIGTVLYICYLLNSRPSYGPFTVLFDKRRVAKSGAEFDFSAGGGAIATEAPFAGHVKYWIGRGDQTTCPAQIVSETAGKFTASDAWRGRTVLWARLDCGDNDSRQERWPATPPELNVEGNWSMVIDPRDGVEKFTSNHAMIVLDALRSNPVRPYADDYLRLDTFAWGCDVSLQPMALKAGGTQPRYRCDGILTFTAGTEIEDQLKPLLDAGAARLTRIGGRMAFIPAVARPSVKTITDVTDGQPLDLVRWRSSDDLYTEGVAQFPAPDRAYETAETPAYIVPGAQAEDGGLRKQLSIDLGFVTDYRQAQRVTKILTMRTRMQRQVSAELFPDCFDLVAGSVATLALPAPYASWNRDYEVSSIEPAAGLNDDESITIRLPTVLQETSDAIYAWDPATEERDMLAGGFDGVRAGVLPPSKPVMITGTAAAATSGNTVIPGVLGAWEKSPSPSALRYEWEWTKIMPAALSGWRAGGILDASAADEAGVYSASLPWVEVGMNYRIRVRTRGSYGASAWVLSDPIQARGPAAVVSPPPAPVAAAVSSSRINITAQQSDDGKATKLRIYANDIDSPLTATLLSTRQAGASVTITLSETGLASGTSRFYFARAEDQWGNLSDFSAGASATTT